VPGGVGSDKGTGSKEHLPIAGIRKMLRGLVGGLCGRRCDDQVSGFFNDAVPEAGAPNIPVPCRRPALRFECLGSLLLAVAPDFGQESDEQHTAEEEQGEPKDRDAGSSV
jgi:hypothetical protein